MLNIKTLIATVVFSSVAAASFAQAPAATKEANFKTPVAATAPDSAAKSAAKSATKAAPVAKKAPSKKVKAKKADKAKSDIKTDVAAPAAK
jgi:hypothetical protein